MADLLAAAWRIVADAAVYRVRKREGANLLTSITLAAAFALPWTDIAWRFVFGVLLNLFVYLLNDCFDVRLDLQAPGRDHRRTQFLADHMAAGWLGVAFSVAALTVIGIVRGTDLLLAFGATVAIVGIYSAVLKKVPLADLLAMFVWGVTMAMVGFPLRSRSGWLLAGLLGFLCMVTEVIQVIRDEPSDRRAGVRTTAVALGCPATAWIGRVLIAASAAYAALLLHRWVGLALLLGTLVPLDPQHAERSWDFIRAVFGLTWLVLLFFFWRTGSLQGWVPLP